MSEAFISGGWRGHTRAEIYIGGAWRLAARYLDPLTVATPSGASNSVSSHFTVPVSVVVSAIPSGGLPPYTYSWAAEADIGPLPTLSGASTATVTATVSVPPGDTFSANLICTVNDSVGSGPASDSTFCTFSNFGV